MPDDDLIFSCCHDLGHQPAKLFDIDFKAASSFFCDGVIVDGNPVDVDYFCARFFCDYSGTSVLACPGIAGNHQLQPDD
jgi:hypothetical protein